MKIKKLGLTIFFSTCAPLALANLAPITLSIQNDTNVDFMHANVVYRNINVEDVNNLQAKTLYPRSRDTFILHRTGYPAQIFITFQIAATERSAPGRETVRWEYVENENRANVCHTSDATPPYYARCSGDNEIAAPDIHVHVGRNEAPRGPDTFPLPSP